MNNILNVGDKCTGCTSCMNACPKGAIGMTEDKAGFFYPVVDDTLCIDCGKCIMVCPVSEESLDCTDTRVRAFYGSSLDTALVSKSSSGGAFSLMAEYVLEKNGLVIGAAFDYDTMNLVYKGTDSCELDELRRSKYVASMPRTIFKQVKEELNKNRLVLFCGLPCHVHGLKSFLVKEYSNLIACDFICGGTASPRFFKEHLAYLEKKHKSRVSKVNFRAKINGWKEHSIKIGFENGKEYRSAAFYDSFFKGYFEKPYQRDSCYQCKYRMKHRSDIIIADYWGGLSKGRGNDTGVSMIITNSQKGDEFLHNVLQKGNHNFVDMPLSDSDYVFKTEEERYTKAFKTKKIFLDLYDKYGFEKAARKTYFRGVLKAKIRNKISKKLHKK